MNPPDLWDLRASLLVNAEHAGSPDPDLLAAARARARQRQTRRVAAGSAGAGLAAVLAAVAIIVPLQHESTGARPAAAPASCAPVPAGLVWPCFGGTGAEESRVQADYAASYPNRTVHIRLLARQAPTATLPQVEVYELWTDGADPHTTLGVTSRSSGNSANNQEAFKPTDALVVKTGHGLYLVVPPGVASAKVGGHTYAIRADQLLAALPAALPPSGHITTYDAAGLQVGQAGYSIASY